jgi:glycosyltransferase involved in cell wall biosynthesis
MKVALVHDWLTGMRGGEKCLEAFCELYPEADIFTLVHREGSVSRTIESRRIVTSHIQGLPRATEWYRYYLPLMPTAVESFDLEPYDLVLSSSHCVAKGAITRPDAVHVSYVHTPMRYLWDLWPRYFANRGLVHDFVVGPMLTWLRSWDSASAARVDRFVANSAFVARRIEKYYRRGSTVVHPPVETEFFQTSRPPGEGYLMVSALVPSKGIEYAIDAFNRSKRRLVIVGRGPLERKLERLAGPTVELVRWLEPEDLRSAYADCAALVHPAVEDFGIVPLEANSCGRPVLALGRGGSLETTVPLQDGDCVPPGRYPTGVLFGEPSSAALEAAVQRFESHRDAFVPERLREHARAFDREVFKHRIREVVSEAMAELHGPREAFREG